MKPNPIKALFGSRKFLLLLLDTIISIASLFITNHLDPELVVELLTVIGILQPLWIMVIKGITDEDVAKMNNAETPPQQLTSAAGFPLPPSFEYEDPDDAKG